MDPLTIVKLLWRHRLIAVPLLVLTLLLCGYLAVFGPRTYQATASYALINPDVPTADELDHNSRLAKLNSDNPYLRSSDPSLAVQVLIAKLTSEGTMNELRSEHLSDQYTVERVANNSLMVVITGMADTPAESLATRDRLGALLTQELQKMQKVNGADDLYLFTALAVDVQSQAQEKISSRLRLLIVALFAGAVLLFGAVSIAESIVRSRRGERRLVSATRRRERAPNGPPAPPGTSWNWGMDERPGDEAPVSSSHSHRSN